MRKRVEEFEKFDDEYSYNELNVDRDNDYNTGKNTKTQVLVLMICILLFFLVYYSVYNLSMYTIGRRDISQMWLYRNVNNMLGIWFDKSSKDTVENYSVKLAALGDIYFTSNTLKLAKLSNGSYDFETGTEKIQDILKDYDIVMASLSTPIADKSEGYSSKQVYNCPDELIETLSKLHINVVATATSHAFDKGETGISDTIENLKNGEIEQIGVSSNTRNNPLIITKNNISIGILSYTSEISNKLKKSKSYMVNTISEENLMNDINYLKSNNVDYIVSYLYVPNENSTITNSEQKKYIEQLFNAGVNVVIGTGNGTVQGQEEDQIEVNDATNHVYVNYSVGDFMGNYEDEENRISSIVNIEFTKEVVKDKKGEIKNTSTDMKVKEPIGLWTKFVNNKSKEIFVIDDEIKLYDSDNSKLTTKDYMELKDAKQKVLDLYQ